MSKKTLHDYFPSDEASNISNEFTVDGSSSTAIINVKGMPDESSFLVEYYFGDDCDGCWQPFQLQCCQMELCGCKSVFYFPFVGKFRLVAIDDNDQYLTDPAFFEDVEVQITKIDDPNKDLSQYYVSCSE